MSFNFSESLQKLLEGLILFIPNLVVAIIILLVTFYLSSLAARGVKRALVKRQTSYELSILLARLTRWSIIVMGVIWALEQVKFDITGFIAGLGVAGFTIGFALKDVAENFVAGILLLLQQPFEIGDIIEVSGYTGTVVEIQIRATVIRTVDGLRVIIPNADVFTQAITNFTQVEQRRIGLKIGVGYETDLPQAQHKMVEVVSNLPGVIKDNPAPLVVFEEFGDSSINATLYFWFDPKEAAYYPTLDGAVKGLKVAFEQEGINIPYPIRTVYMQPLPA